MSDLRAYILCRFADQSSIYNSWTDACPLECVTVDDHAPDWSVPKDAGIVISHMHYRWEEISALRRIYEQGRVPVLILADGILEYRNTWEHPDLPDGAMFQPLIGHKLATIGRSQSRVVESWGNVGQCEVVGLPRLDSVAASSFPPVRSQGPFRLLIATANTPAFDDQQRAIVIRSLQHIKDRLEQNSRVNGRLIDVTWRLTDGLDQEIGLPALEKEDRPPIAEVIENVDAVITTPSTIYLESILRRRPTAILDFYNSPSYVSGAWAVNAPVHFNSVLRELADPPHHKMLFQDSVLHDHLECKAPATPRMLDLVQRMVGEGVSARAENRPITMPARILADTQNGFAQVSSEFALDRLFPKNESFKNQDVMRLQSELNQAIGRLDSLPIELAEKARYLTDLSSLLQTSKVRNAEMHARIIEMRARINKLREKLGMPAKPVKKTPDAK